MDLTKGMKESQIKYHICKRLLGYQQLGRLYYFRVNSGSMASNYTTKAGLYRQHFLKLAPTGMSDIIVFLPACCLFLEVKDEKGIQSPGQVKFQETIEKLGYEYFIVRNLDDVEKILESRWNKTSDKLGGTDGE